MDFKSIVSTDSTTRPLIHDSADLLALKDDVTYILLYLYRICQVFFFGGNLPPFILDQCNLFGVILCRIKSTFPDGG